MGLLCEILGHSFGDSRMEKRQEDRDGGTVLVTREYRTCQRCGSEEELYENRGVISSGIDESEQDQKSTDDLEPADDTREPNPETPKPQDSDPQEIDTGESQSSPAEPGKGTVIQQANAAGDKEGDETESAGEINADERDQQPVADDEDAPETEDSEPDQQDTDGTGGVIISETVTDQSPDQDGAKTPLDDAVILSDSSSAQDGDTSSTEPDAEQATEELSVNSSQTSRSPQQDSPSTEEPRFQCPECGFEVPAESTSIRAGDICTACRVDFFELVPEG